MALKPVHTELIIDSNHNIKCEQSFDATGHSVAVEVDGVEVIDLQTLHLSGLQTHRDPAQLQQSPGGPDTFAIAGEDRKQGGSQPPEPQAGVSSGGRC